MTGHGKFLQTIMNLQHSHQLVYVGASFTNINRSFKATALFPKQFPLHDKQKEFEKHQCKRLHLPDTDQPAVSTVYYTLNVAYCAQGCEKYTFKLTARKNQEALSIVAM